MITIPCARCETVLNIPSYEPFFNTQCPACAAVLEIAEDYWLDEEYNETYFWEVTICKERYYDTWLTAVIEPQDTTPPLLRIVHLQMCGIGSLNELLRYGFDVLDVAAKLLGHEAKPKEAEASGAVEVYKHVPPLFGVDYYGVPDWVKRIGEMESELRLFQQQGFARQFERYNRYPFPNANRCAPKLIATDGVITIPEEMKPIIKKYIKGL